MCNIKKYKEIKNISVGVINIQYNFELKQDSLKNYREIV